MRRVSRRRKQEGEAYSILRKAFLEARPFCEAKVGNCTHHASDVHHKSGRGRFYLDVTTWLPVCANCHRWITDHGRQAEALGLITRHFGG